VRIAYLDTSAAMKLVLDEPQSEALATELSGRDDRRLVSSWLLHTEMHCAAGRHPEEVDLSAVRSVLDTEEPSRPTAMSQSWTSPHRGALTLDGHESKLDLSTHATCSTSAALSPTSDAA